MAKEEALHELDTLGVNETAKYLKCSINTVRSKAASGEIPGAKIGKRWVFLRGELAEFIRTKYIEQISKYDCRPDVVKYPKGKDPIILRARHEAKMRKMRDKAGGKALTLREEIDLLN